MTGMSPNTANLQMLMTKNGFQDGFPQDTIAQDQPPSHYPSSGILHGTGDYEVRLKDQMYS